MAKKEPTDSLPGVSVNAVTEDIGDISTFDGGVPMVKSTDEPAAVAKPEPHAVVTAAAVTEAINACTWTHDNASIQLWLNSAFPAAKREAEELIADLNAHGIFVAP